jgi:hypothetical protein
MISLTVFVPGRGIGLCVGLVTELFVSATTYWYLAACMQMRSHSKRAREIETYITSPTAKRDTHSDETLLHKKPKISL